MGGMAYIFLDENGDLGFQSTSSRWFLFAIAMVSEPRAIERVVKRVWRPLKKKHKKLGELHAYHADDVTRARVLKGLKSVPDLKVLCVVLNKQKVHIDLQNQKNYLYNYTANILLERLYMRGTLKAGEPVNLYSI